MKTKAKTHHTTLPTKSCNGYSSESSSSSPPSSPRRSSRGPHYLRRLRSKVHLQTHHRESFFSSVLLRCNVRLFLLLPLFYFSGLLMCVGTFSAFLRSVPSVPGSVYRSPEVFLKLWPEIQSDNASAIELSSVWKYRRRLKEWKNCSSASTGGHSGSTQPIGYLIVEANGGLNQQRSSVSNSYGSARSFSHMSHQISSFYFETALGFPRSNINFFSEILARNWFNIQICNAVAVAALLNAVLVIPQFQFHSVWRDPSGFGDIYDEDHFITTLRGYVTVVRELPESLMERYANNISNIPIFRAKAWSPASYYLGEVYPILQNQGVIRIAPFANRLAMEVPSNIQYLRCLANYEALRFSAPTAKLARELVNRMIKKSSMTGGKYVSIHLRFEEDMVAFSCCVYDGGWTEKLEMDAVREKGWRGKFKSKTRVIDPGLNRINGKCPLTPLEVGMMLRGMGFDNNTSIYLASGKIYQAERSLAPLLKMFPLLQTKESLATQEELASFEGYSSRLAALDYTVCLFSEVFVTTQGGNFPHFLMGHRRFLYNGHAKTIKPDKQKLVFLLQDSTISWKAFKEHMKLMLIESDRVTVIKTKKARRRSSIYSNPFPECWCLQASPNFTVGSHMLGQKLEYLV